MREYYIMTHTHGRKEAHRAADSRCHFPPDSHRYADLLQKKLAKHGTQCFLINTGWTGGGYGVGKRMSLPQTRACVHAVLDGTINKSSFIPDPVGCLSFILLHVCSGFGRLGLSCWLSCRRDGRRRLMHTI